MSGAGVRIFVSYARKEARFLRRLAGRLVDEGHIPTYDTADIAPNEAWRKRIDELIRKADAVVFVLSPAWAKSRVSREEFQCAKDLGKLLAPVVLESVSGQPIPNELTSRNYVFFNRRALFQSEAKAFDKAIGELNLALRVANVEWRRKLNTLMERATVWQASGVKTENLLLAPGEMENARDWLRTKPPLEEDIPDLLRRFLDASEQVVGALGGELTLTSGFVDLPPDQVRRLPTALVVADYGVIPYDDSRGLKADFLAWANAPAEVAGRLYAAGGGFGKTRLALDVIDTLAKTGWRAGVLPRSAFETKNVRGEQDVDTRLARFLSSRGDKGALLVLDYAESRARQVERVTAAALRAPKGSPIRIVLLARSAANWWESLRRDNRDIELVFDETPVAAIAAEIDANAREAFFQSAAATFAARLKEAEAADDALLSPGWEARVRPINRLHSPEAGSPLALAFEAYLHVRGIDAQGSPLLEMAREERRHWARALKIPASTGGRMRDPRVEAMHRTAAVLTLAQGVPFEPGDTADKTLDDAMGVSLNSFTINGQSNAERGKVYASVQTGIDALYRDVRPEGDVWRPVLPDLLGERIVGEAVGRAPDIIEGVLEHSADLAFSALTVANRATRVSHAGEPVHSISEVVSPIEGALANALSKRLVFLVDPVLAVVSNEQGSLAALTEEALRALPEQKRAETGVALLRSLPVYADPNAAPDHLRSLTAAILSSARPAPIGEAGDRQRANDLFVRGSFLARIGDFKGARAAAEEAVSLYRELARSGELEMRARLAESLNNFSNRLADVGEVEIGFAARRGSGLTLAQPRGEIRSAPS